MDQDEFEEKYFSLSSSDMSKVSAAIYGMEAEFMEDEDEDDSHFYNEFDDPEYAHVFDDWYLLHLYNNVNYMRASWVSFLSKQQKQVSSSI